MAEVSTPSNRAATLNLCLAMLICALIGGLVRWQHDARMQRIAGLDNQQEWFSTEADGLYHLRRVERLMDHGLPVASFDERLNSPHGANIPWPPYYDMAAYLLAAPFAPDAELAAAPRPSPTPAVQLSPRRQYLEHFLAMLPFIFGLLICMLTAWAAWRLGPFYGELHSAEPSPSKLLAALFAGGYLASQFSAAHYSAPGIADHHAWVSLLTLVLWMLVSTAFRADVLNQPRKSLHLGLASGAVAGVLLGSWVASLLSILILQLCLGVLLFKQSRLDSSGHQQRSGLAAFGLSFHLTAAVVALPAILASPWKDELPWMVVNLSWFHLAELLLGALVFVPLLRAARRRGAQPKGVQPERAQAKGARPSRWTHPLLLPVCIAVALAISVISNFGPGAGIREGLAWVSRADEFMSGIAESEPLWGADTFKIGGAFDWLGFGILLLPFAWLAMLRQFIRHRRDEYLPWLIAIPVLLLQAFAQRRFAEALAAPMAITLGWAVAHAMRWLPLGLRRRALPGGVLVLILAVVLNGSAPLSAIFTPQATRDADGIANAKRELYEWIGAQEKLGPVETVLAVWDQGHAIEWSTGRGTVATNFGTYVGQDSYRDPARFFLTSDPAFAQEILEQRQVRYVVRDSQLALALDQLSAALGTGETFAETFVDDRGRQRHRFKDNWSRTMAAKLNIPGPASSLPFLRLVHLSPLADSDPRHGGQTLPAGSVWEHVKGAIVQVKSQAGHILRIKLGINVMFQGKTLIGFEYHDSALAGADGLAILNLPYATQFAQAGDAQFLRENQDCRVAVATFSIEDSAGTVFREGTLQVPESAVLKGSIVLIP